MREEFRLLVGLGNPGSEYASTRHNLGFRVADRLAKTTGTGFRRGYGGLWAIMPGPGKGLCLLKPQTFMNLSGKSVAALCRERGISPGEILVACDDLDLPLGRLRLRRGGGTGGHRRLASIAGTLGTNEFARLRLGVGRPPEGMDAAAYVLTPFTPLEEGKVLATVERAILTVEILGKQGWEAAMNFGHAPEPVP